jgi:phosphatidylglycerol:prolipoprotein diacylglycerol transferase
MYPILFEIFGFKVHSYGVLLILGFFAALWVARRRAPRYGFTPEEVSDIGFWTLIFGVLGARVVYILLELPHFLSHPNEILSWQFQGLTSFGGLIFGFLYLLFWCWRKKRSFLSLLDLVSAPALVGFGFGRIGCLLNGCCYGALCKPGDLFCVAVDHEPGLYVPAQLYDSLMNFAAFGLLVWMESRFRQHANRPGLGKGLSFALFLILHGTARFIYEIFRAGASSEVLPMIGLTLAQITALAFIVAGVALYLRAASSARIEREAMDL